MLLAGLHDISEKHQQMLLNSAVQFLFSHLLSLPLNSSCHLSVIMKIEVIIY